MGVETEEFTQKIQLYAHSEIKLIIERARLSSQSLVLDLGCGNLRHSLAFTRLGMKPIGIDLAPERSKAGIAVAANWNRLPFKDQQFDCAVLLFSGLDWEDSNSALSEISRVLKPGGHFIFNKTDTEKVIKDYLHNGTLDENNQISWIKQEEIANGIIFHKCVLDLATLEETIWETQSFPPNPDVYYQYNSRLLRKSTLEKLLSDTGLTLVDSWAIFHTPQHNHSPHNYSFYMATKKLKS